MTEVARGRARPRRDVSAGGRAMSAPISMDDLPVAASDESVTTPRGIRGVVTRYPLASFFAAAYGASLIALAVLGFPPLHPTATSPSTTSLILFPLMVLAVGAAGVGLTRLIGGPGAARALLRTIRLRVSPGWYATLLIPPACILAALGLLHVLDSSVFTPNLFPIGLTFGLVAGFFEELGWTGFACPRMRTRFGALRGALLLGVLWGLWHLPVVDSLGAAAPHGTAWPVFFLAFVGVLTALRVLIARIWSKTSSLLLAQLMHASSTGFLVVLGAAHVTAHRPAPPPRSPGWPPRSAGPAPPAPAAPRPSAAAPGGHLHRTQDRELHRRHPRTPRRVRRWSHPKGDSTRPTDTKPWPRPGGRSPAAAARARR
jgi:uncharacterized protein